MLKNNSEIILENLDIQISSLQKEYSKNPKNDGTLGKIERLTKIRADYVNSLKKSEFKDYVPIITAGIGLIGLAMITNFEKTEILTTKGFSIVSKMLGR